MDEARSELTRIIQDREMKDALLLVFANKQDVSGGKQTPLNHTPCSCPDPLCTFNRCPRRTFAHIQMLELEADTWETAMRPKEVSDALNLAVIAKDHTWKVEPSCATTGEGIFEGLAWLSSHVKLPTR